jgi:type VI secretion system secreted protein Hcp
MQGIQLLWSFGEDRGDRRCVDFSFCCGRVQLPQSSVVTFVEWLFEGQEKRTIATSRSLKSENLYTYGVQSPRDTSTGQASGKRQYQPFTITKEIDGGSPSLFRSVCNHEVFDKLNIDFEQVDSKGSKQPYLAMNLTNVTIVDVKRKPHPGKAIAKDAHELEEISFAFQKIVVVHKNSKSSMDDDWVAVH